MKAAREDALVLENCNSKGAFRELNDSVHTYLDKMAKYCCSIRNDTFYTCFVRNCALCRVQCSGSEHLKTYVLYVRGADRTLKSKVIVLSSALYYELDSR